MKKNKLGVTYSVFCGEELLRSSIMSVRNQVDYINVVWQEYSWTGERMDENLLILLKELINEGLIQKIIKFEFEVSQSAKKNSYYQCKKKTWGSKI